MKSRLAAADTLIGKGLVGEADIYLAKSSKGQAGENHMSVTMDLLRVAFIAQENGRKEAAEAAARLALVRLSKAEASAHENKELLTAIYEIRAVISERILGTSDEAAVEIKKALIYSPDSSSARAKLSRLESRPMDRDIVDLNEQDGGKK